MVPDADSVAEYDGFAEIAATLQLLYQQAHFAALEGDRDGFASAVEKIRPLSLTFAHAYRQWMIRGAGGPAPAPVADNRMSV